MEHKSYSEYKPPFIITFPYIYYPVGALILSFVYLILIGVFCLLYSDCNYIQNITNNIILLIGLFYLCVVRPRLGRVRIHTDGHLEILFFGTKHHQKISVSDIRKIDIHRNWSVIYGDSIVLLLSMKKGKTSRICIQDNEQFLAELKSHNPNIIIPELPVL